MLMEGKRMVKTRLACFNKQMNTNDKPSVLQPSDGWSVRILSSWTVSCTHKVLEYFGERQSCRTSSPGRGRAEYSEYFELRTGHRR